MSNGTGSDRLTYTVPEAARRIGIGRTTAYRLAREKGELLPGVPVIQVGPRLLVSKARLHAALDDPVRPNSE